MKYFNSSNLRARPGLWFSILLLVLYVGAAMLASTTVRADDCPKLLRGSYKDLQMGVPKDLCEYRGKVLMVVNTASYRAYPDQYSDLEALHRKHQDEGLVVLGFPSNDFGGQESGSNNQIAHFCRMTYGVEFPMFEKSHVIGERRIPLFAEPHRRTGHQPRWNFHKYIIARDGERVVSFSSNVSPKDHRLLDQLRAMLEAGEAQGKPPRSDASQS
jgi:glutathione peroxidase